MTKLSQLKIDPEFQNQINPPSFEETHQLEMNILKEERVLNPIITLNGYIVDGHELIEDMETQLAEIQGQIDDIHQEKITADNIYHLLLAFDEVYNAATEVEQK